MLYKIQATYFPVFGLNTGKYEPEKTPYLDTFHAVLTEVLFMNSTYFAKVNGKSNYSKIYQPASKTICTFTLGCDFNEQL